MLAATLLHIPFKLKKKKEKLSIMVSEIYISSLA